MEFFSHIGARVEQLWRARNFDEHVFPEIATVVLSESSPAQHITYADVIDALLFGTAMPPQPQDLSFGQPPITVYSHPRFYIEVLCWMDATTSIHQHAFSGAFHVLHGSSVHTRYEFHPRKRINQHFIIGDVRFAACELLQAGDTRTIHAGSEFIHALFHLDRPSISIVLRTRVEVDTGPQYDYVPPYLAINRFEKNPVDAQRELIMRMLLATDPAAFTRLVRAVVTEADLPTVYRMLSFAYTHAVVPPYDLSHDEVDALAEMARKRFGDLGDTLLTTIASAARIDDIALRRAEVTDLDHRFFLALLMNLPNQVEIYNLVAKRFDSEPSQLVMRWLRELTQVASDGTVSLLDIELGGTAGHDDPTRADAVMSLLHTVIEHMLDGAQDDALLARLHDALPAVDIEEIEDAIVELQGSLLRGALQPLFVVHVAVCSVAGVTP
jgi:hypothetical protein